MHMLLVPTLFVALLGQTNGSSGTTSVQNGWDRPSSSKLGIENENPFESEQLDRPLTHIVRQMNDLPAPNSTAPLPVPSRFEKTYQAQNKPATLDYIYMGKSSVEEPATSGVLMNQIGFDYRLVRPFFKTPAAFTFRPATSILFMSGPGGIDLPEQLYMFAFDFQLDIPVNERIGVSLGITPGIWSDLVVITNDSFRLPARALFTFKFSDTLFFAGGPIYTDNIRRNIIPGIGVIWDPNEKWHLELLYPRSRIVYRINDSWAPYLAIERGGTTYSIRLNNANSDFEYRDYRLMLGIDIGQWTAANLFAECGFTFDRRFRFDYLPQLTIQDSFILRVGARF